MVATDNSNIEDRIIHHVKCPYCRSEDVMGYETYMDKNRLMCEFICNRCMSDKTRNEIEYSVPITTTARIEVITLPNGRQQLYFHLYEQSTVEDKLDSSIESS